MAKIITIDRKLRTVGGKLVTDAGGAPCCCGDDGCSVWQRMGRCDNRAIKLWACHDPRSKCTNGTNATGGSKVLFYEGHCWQLENAFEPDPPQNERIPPGVIFDCYPNCTTCQDCTDCCDVGPCGWLNGSSGRVVTVSGAATGTNRRTVSCFAEGCTTRTSTVANTLPGESRAYGCNACNISVTDGVGPIGSGQHYSCAGPDGPNTLVHSVQYRVRLNQPESLSFAGFTARDGALTVTAPYALVTADMLMGKALEGGNVGAFLVAAVNLETGVWGAGLNITGINADDVEAMFSVTGGSGCSTANIAALVDFTITEDDGGNCAPGHPDRFSGSLSVNGVASSIRACPATPEGREDRPEPAPRSLLDPRIASTLDQQARGGGCSGCGEGFAG